MLSDEQIDAVIERLFPNNNAWHSHWMEEIARPIARAIESALSQSTEQGERDGATVVAMPAIDLTPWEKPRYGAFHPDGRFEELPAEGWENHPLAHTARWVGGRHDMELLRAAMSPHGDGGRG